MGKLLILKDGIWQAEEEIEISYPKEASDDYFKIEEDSFWFRHRNNFLLEIIKKFPPKGPIYDVGGGNGLVSVYLEKNGFPTFLIEPNIAGAINAKKRGLKNIFCTTLGDSNLLKGSLDAIGIFDVLEHIEDDVKFLLELKEYLKIGGRLYITVPAYNFLWSADDKYARHFRRYSPKSLSAILKNNGFSLDYRTNLFSFLPLPIYFFKSLFYKLGFSREKTSVVANDHNKNNYFLDKILDWELGMVKRGREIKFGSSCLAVAKKVF